MFRWRKEEFSSWPSTCRFENSLLLLVLMKLANTNFFRWTRAFSSQLAQDDSKMNLVKITSFGLAVNHDRHVCLGTTNISFRIPSRPKVFVLVVSLSQICLFGKSTVSQMREIPSALTNNLQVHCKWNGTFQSFFYFFWLRLQIGKKFFFEIDLIKFCYFCPNFFAFSLICHFLQAAV